MKRKYCLIRCDGDLNPSSFVYVVWVGSSLRESAILALVEEYTKDCGWYFKRWSHDVDSALEKRSKYSRVDGNRSAPAFTMMSVSLEKIYQTIIDDSWKALERQRVMTPQEKFMRFRFDPSYLKAMNTKQRNTTCSPSKSKYLSRRNRESIRDFVRGMVAILLIIIVDALVSTHILNSLF